MTNRMIIANATARTLGIYSRRDATKRPDRRDVFVDGQMIGYLILRKNGTVTACTRQNGTRTRVASGLPTIDVAARTLAYACDAINVA